MTTSAPASLTGTTVLDLGSEIAAPFCAELLLGLGARVIKVEDRRGGDPLRYRGPFLDDLPGPERGGLFHYVNAGKEGATLDLSTASGRDLLHQLARHADVLIEDRESAVLASLGLDFETLHRANPALLVVSITPFGRTGPWQDWRATDLTLYHVSGLGYATPGLVTDPATQPPLRAGSYQALFVSALNAAINVAAALFAARIAGEREGLHIDFSCYEALVNTLRQGIGSYAFNGTGINRDMARGHGAGGLNTSRNLPCKDGFVQLHFAGERHWEALKEMLGYPAWAADKSLSTPGLRARNWPVLVERLSAWTTTLTKRELFFLCQGHYIPCAPVNDGEELLGYAALEDRGFWRQTDVEGRAVPMPGAPVQLTRSPLRYDGRGPALGEHNAAVFCSLLGLSRIELVELAETGVI